MDVASAEAALLPARKRWTRLEYARLLDLGVLGEDSRVELIDGDIIEKMPQKSPHATAVSLAERALRPAPGEACYIRCQLPLTLGERSEPEPDIALVRGAPRDYELAHPSTAILVVEIADSSLPVDRAKARVYAGAGIREYWIVNIAERRVEVYRDPSAAREQPLAFVFTTVSECADGDTIQPLHAPSLQIAVADLLPRP